MRAYFLAGAIGMLPGVALAAPVVWEGEVSLRGYDCAREGRDGIVVKGSVTLVHPEDKAHSDPAQEINISCQSLTFEQGSELSSLSGMYIRIDGTSSGPIKLINTRGIKGKDAAPTPDIWEPRKMANGGNGSGGGNGRNATGCEKLWESRGSKPGGAGERGANGASGLLFTAPAGANGQKGNSAADITFISRFLASGTTLEILAVGGDGGAGGRGGRGADGGDGGSGGTGGNGGAASSCHTADHGGNGGNGGDGGDGGNGGPGGDGGDGGNGGNVLTAIQEGSGTAVVPIIRNNGGRGGDPGPGGEQGLGGKGGNGGSGGYGGDGDGGIIGLGKKGPGDPGLAGVAGKPGRPGKPGPWGQPGKDGQNGLIGKGFSGTLPAEALDKLFKFGS